MERELWVKENLEAYLQETGVGIVAEKKKGKKAAMRKKGMGVPEPMD